MPFKSWILLTDKNLHDYHFNQISGCMAVYPSLLGSANYFLYLRERVIVCFCVEIRALPKWLQAWPVESDPGKYMATMKTLLQKSLRQPPVGVDGQPRVSLVTGYVWCLGSIQLIREQSLGAALRFQMWVISDSWVGTDCVLVLKC